MNTCKHNLIPGPKKDQCYECWYKSTLPRQRGRPTTAPDAEMNERTIQVLEAIRIAEKVGVNPTVRELQAACRLSSTSVVLYHLRQLERRGCITFGQQATTRHIRLTDKGRGYPSDTELLKRCLDVLEQRYGAVGGALLEDLHARLA